MKKLFYFVILAGFLFVGINIVSCGSDDNKSNPENPDGQVDNGKDGLKGYWMVNTWYNVNFDEQLGYNTQVTGDINTILYLDGEGGGMIYESVTTIEKIVVKNDSGRVKDKHKYTAGFAGRFYDPADGSEMDYYFTHRYLTKISEYSGTFVNYEEIKNQIYPLTYYIQGSTMTIYYKNNTESRQLNVVSGQVANHHRINKVG